MSFGKRGSGEGHPARNLLPLPPVEEQEGTGTVGRMKVANPGGIDKSFIALALGVIVVSAGAAVAAPSVFEMIAGGQVRPIEEIVAGLDKDRAKSALARDAFPDGDGRAFMTKLQAEFPQDHDKLLTRLADKALDGGDRSDLLVAMNTWSFDFVRPNISAIGRSGADGFDQMLEIGSGTFGLMEKTTGCTGEQIMAFAENPKALANLADYGSEGYKFNMKTTRTMVELAAMGRSAPMPSLELLPEDNEALMTAFFGMMTDPQVMGLMQTASRGSGVGAEDPSAKIDLCKLGRSVIYKLKRLPHGTKERLLAIGTTGLGPMMTPEFMEALSSGRGGFPGMSGMNASPSGFPAGMMDMGPGLP